MRVLIDESVIADFMKQSSPKHDQARKLMLCGYVGWLDLWMSAAQVPALLDKLGADGSKARAGKAKESMRKLCKFVRISGLVEGDVADMLDSNWASLQAMLVNQAALRVGAEAIVTHNKKPYKKSSLRVLTCEELFDWLQEYQNVEFSEIPV